MVPLQNELGTAAELLAREVLEPPTDIERAKALEARLHNALPVAHPDAILARDLVERVRADPSLNRAAALSALSALAPRVLQRMFQKYVGVGPKWVVRRFRLQEAAELLATSSEAVATVAASLGYFDQAHFARDFKAVVGTTPWNTFVKHEPDRLAAGRSN